MKSKRLWLLTIILGLVVVLSSCGPKPQSVEQPVTPPSPAQLPHRDVTFQVKVPDNTPPNDIVYVLVMPLLDWAWVDHVPLTREDDETWSGTVLLEEGALVRYVYDRWDEQSWGEAFKTTREASGDSIAIENRYVLVTADLVQVEDTIETWADRRQPAATGTIKGIVVDLASGQPLMDTSVSIGGLHTTTDYDGHFKVDGIAIPDVPLYFSF